MFWNISREIRSRRGVVGMTMSDVAVANGVRRQTIRDIQEGITWPDEVTLARIGSVRELAVQLGS